MPFTEKYILERFICAIEKNVVPLHSKKNVTMEDNFAIQLFEGNKVRIVWDEEQEKYYFSVVDIVQVLTGSVDGRKYWNKLKQRLSAEGNESVTNCHQLKLLSSDGKRYKTDVADLQGIFRIIQSIPSKKAEPVKQWLAQLGEQRIDQMIDPEQTFQMAVEDYRRQGYSDKWINERMRSIEMRKELTDEWQRAGITEHKDFAILTNVLTKAWSGMTTGEYKRHKGLTKENLRDNMTNVELALNTLAEVTATEISRQRNPKGMAQSAQTAKEGGEVARSARADIESRLGCSIISSERASDHIRPIEEGKAQELPFKDEDKEE